MEELNQEEKEIIKVYRRLVKETNSKNWIICNPEMMWSTHFVPISLIEKEIEEYEEIGMIGVADCMKRLLDKRGNTDV